MTKISINSSPFSSSLPYSDSRKDVTRKKKTNLYTTVPVTNYRNRYITGTNIKVKLILKVNYSVSEAEPVLVGSGSRFSYLRARIIFTI